jgi:hypothetical protein
MTKTKTTLQGNALLAGVSVIVTLLALELCVRGYTAYVSWRYPGENASAPVYMYDPVRGWKMTPNTTVFYSRPDDFIRTRITTNSHGLRDTEHTYEKKKSVFRICLIGNSAIAGFEVDQKYLLNKRLERLLNGGSTSSRFEVINFGVRGYGTDQSYLTMTTDVARYAPDLVLYVFSGNDCSDNITVRNPNRKYGKSYFSLGNDGRLELKGVPVPRHFSDPDRYITVFNVADTAAAVLPRGNIDNSEKQGRTTVWKSMKRGFSHSALYRLARTAFRGNAWLEGTLGRFHVLEDLRMRPAQDRVMEQEKAALTGPGAEAYKTRLLGGLLCAMRASADSIGAKFLFYEMSNGSGDMPQMPTMAKRLCDSCAIPYINSIPVFFQDAKGSKKYSFMHDGHWNIKGHALAAHIIYDYLMTSLHGK